MPSEHGFTEQQIAEYREAFSIFDKADGPYSVAQAVVCDHLASHVRSLHQIIGRTARDLRIAM